MNAEKREVPEPVHPTGQVPGVLAPRIPPATRGGHAGPPHAQAGAVTPIALLRALRRRSTLATGVALLLTGIAAPSAWFLVPSAPYQAEASLHVAAQAPKILFQTIDAQNAGGDYNRYQSTQRTLVKSRMVLSAALRDPKISNCRMLRQQVDPVDWLGQKLKVEFVAGSEVMQISLAGSDPVELASIINAVKQAYMDEVVNVDSRLRSARHERLKKLKETYSGLLKMKRETMRKLAETVGSDDRETLALRQQYAFEHLHYLQTELLGVRSQKRKIEAELKALRPAGAGEGTEGEVPSLSEEEIDRLVDRHPAVIEVAERLAEEEERLDAERAKARRVARNAGAEPIPGILANAANITRRLLERRRREVRPEVIRQAQEHGTIVADSTGRDLVRELAMQTELERRLEEDIKKISVANQSLTSSTLDLHGNQDEIAQIQGTADKIVAEVEALNVELEAPARIRPIDDATVPRTRDDKKRYIMIGMITLGSFFGGLIGIAFLEVQARKVDTADEVSDELGLPIVGALPVLPAREQQTTTDGRRKEKEKDRYWRSVLLESVDATRTLLVHAARTGAYRVVMITSAVGGEGKTSLASYLAASLARAGLKTLLIDADLRRPMMHTLFDRPPAPGLAEVLRGEIGLDDALGETAVDDLTLMAAGRCDRLAIRNLSQGGIGPVFDELKRRYEFIIVDSSPLLPVADAMLIAQHADAALFSVFSDVSRKAKVKAAVERLQRLGVPVLGAVVTGAHSGPYGNGYYYEPDSSYATVPESVAVPPVDPS